MSSLRASGLILIFSLKQMDIMAAFICSTLGRGNLEGKLLCKTQIFVGFNVKSRCNVIRCAELQKTRKENHITPILALLGNVTNNTFKNKIEPLDVTGDFLLKTTRD